MNQAPNRSNSNNPANPNTGSPGPNPLNIPNNPAGSQIAQLYTPVFTTDKIQHTKATRPKEYFDEQNRKSAEKKKQDNKNRKTIIIIGAAIVGALVLIGVVWFILIKIMPVEEPQNKIPIPTLTSGSDEEISEVQNYLQMHYGDYVDNAGAEIENSPEVQTKLDEADAALNQILAEPNSEKYKNQILLAQLRFYLENGFYAKAVELDGEIDLNALTLEQQGSYYNLLARAYAALGEDEKTQEYFQTSIDIFVKVGGIGG